MQCDLATYLEALATAIATGPATAAWQTAYGQPLYVSVGQSPVRRDAKSLPAVVVMPDRHAGGQGAENTTRHLAIDCRLAEADAGEPATETGSAVRLRHYRAHLALVGLVDAVLKDLTAGLDGQDAAWAVDSYDVDFDGSNWPLLLAYITLSFVTANSMPHQ